MVCETEKLMLIGGYPNLKQHKENDYDSGVRSFQGSAAVVDEGLV